MKGVKEMLTQYPTQVDQKLETHAMPMGGKGKRVTSGTSARGRFPMMRRSAIALRVAPILV